MNSQIFSLVENINRNLNHQITDGDSMNRIMLKEDFWLDAKTKAQIS